MISLDYKDGKSLHQQIEDGFKNLIINGVLQENEQLPSVRELSVNLTINPNTVQRAYKQLEAEGYTYSVQGKGSFVASLKGQKDEKRANELYDILILAVKELRFLGEDKKNMDKIIDNIYKEGVCAE